MVAGWNMSYYVKVSACCCALKQDPWYGERLYSKGWKACTADHADTRGGYVAQSESDAAHTMVAEPIVDSVDAACSEHAVLVAGSGAEGTQFPLWTCADPGLCVEVASGYGAGVAAVCGGRVADPQARS